MLIFDADFHGFIFFSSMICIFLIFLVLKLFFVIFFYFLNCQQIFFYFISLMFIKIFFFPPFFSSLIAYIFRVFPFFILSSSKTYKGIPALVLHLTASQIFFYFLNFAHSPKFCNLLSNIH